MDNPTYSALHTTAETETLIHEAEEEIVALVRVQAKVKDEARMKAKAYRERLDGIQSDMDRHVGIIDELKVCRSRIERQPELPFSEPGATNAESAPADASAEPTSEPKGATVLSLVPPTLVPSEPVCEACGGAGERHEGTGEFEDGGMAGEKVEKVRVVKCLACRGTGKPHVVCTSCDGDGRFAETADTPAGECVPCDGTGFVPKPPAVTMEPEVPRADDLPSSTDPAPDSETGPTSPVAS